jgi:hypothetical protein
MVYEKRRRMNEKYSCYRSNYGGIISLIGIGVVSLIELRETKI